MYVALQSGLPRAWKQQACSFDCVMHSRADRPGAAAAAASVFSAVICVLVFFLRSLRLFCPATATPGFLAAPSTLRKSGVCVIGPSRPPGSRPRHHESRPRRTPTAAGLHRRALHMPLYRIRAICADDHGVFWRTIRLGHGLHGVIEQCAVVAVEGAAEVVQK